MNDNKLKKLLNMYYENNQISEYNMKKEETATAQKYNAINYQLEKAIGIMLDNENIWIICTKVFKYDDSTTIVRVYNNSESMEEYNLFCSYYPVGNFLEYPAK